MKVNKFGGASVKNAEGIKNISHIIKDFNEHTIVVVSAIGKTTNLLESITRAFYNEDDAKWDLFNTLKENHLSIINFLFEGKTPFITNDIENILLELECFLDRENKTESYDFYYDQIVPFGEILASRILAHYLNFVQVKSHWVDSRNFIVTDDYHREARIDWDSTCKVVKNQLRKLANKSTVVMQGFISRSHKGTNTTLGREGSDYTAAILAHCLDSKSVTIWKDVDGVMNADPKRFDEVEKIDKISFNEAIELAYYGATIIHPKTIQPLKAKKIPLFVKSFINPKNPGTQVLESEKCIQIPCIIVKDNQCLINIKSKDLSFIAENHLQNIFSIFSKHKLRMHVMQNSAISFTCCTDRIPERVSNLVSELKELFEVELIDDVYINSIYNYQISDKYKMASNPLLKQFNETVYHEVLAK
jgi:aspartate kinase